MITTDLDSPCDHAPNGESARDLFVGIDLAIARSKRLPVAACRRLDTKLCYLDLRAISSPPPRGMGNAGALESQRRSSFVDEIVTWLQRLEADQGRSIRRIAIDAPASPCAPEQDRRLAEVGLDHAHISCFSTPTSREFEQIAAEAKRHLGKGGAISRLPYANKIWMLVGFDLFAALKAKWECIEVYPQAIIRSLGAGLVHKTKSEGFASQCSAFARAIGHSEGELKANLRSACYGAAHDRLDAMMSAWVASLQETDRIAYGNGLEDVIWVPRNRLEATQRPLAPP